MKLICKWYIKLRVMVYYTSDADFIGCDIKRHKDYLLGGRLGSGNSVSVGALFIF